MSYGIYLYRLILAVRVGHQLFSFRVRREQHDVVGFYRVYYWLESPISTFG